MTETFEYVRSDSVAYAYTIKDNRRVNNEDREETYSLFFKKCKVYNIEIPYKVSELDKNKVLHYHGIMYIKKGFYRKKLMCKDLHLKLVELYNFEGWHRYIMKDYTQMEPDSEYDPEDDHTTLQTNITLL